MFRGATKVTLDAKGRMVMPTRYRERLAERGEAHLNVFESAAGINLLDALHMLTRALPLFVDRCLVGLRANEERCRELAAAARSAG